MKKKIGFGVLFFMLFGLLPLGAEAAESEMKQVFTDGFYGGLAGALVGAAIMALTDEPKDHLNNILIGAGVGVIAGTVYGVAKAGRAFAEIHDGRITFQTPTIRLNPDPSGKIASPFWWADLLRIPF